MRDKTLTEKTERWFGCQKADTALDRIQRMLAIMRLLDTDTLTSMAADLAKPDTDIAPIDLAEWQLAVSAEPIGRIGD